MNEWSAEELSRAIERRRGRPRRARGVVRDAPAKPASDWSKQDWLNRFSFETGYRPSLRGVTQVCIRDTDGAVMWEGGVREFGLPVEPWIGYAWFTTTAGKLRFLTAVQGETIRCAEDAVRAQL